MSCWAGNHKTLPAQPLRRCLSDLTVRWIAEPDRRTSLTDVINDQSPVEIYELETFLTNRSAHKAVLEHVICENKYVTLYSWMRSGSCSRYLWSEKVTAVAPKHQISTRFYHRWRGNLLLHVLLVLLKITLRFKKAITIMIFILVDHQIYLKNRIVLKLWTTYTDQKTTIHSAHITKHILQIPKLLFHSLDHCT